MKFGYTSRREMEPRPGRKYSTIYYKQSASERARTFEHVKKTIENLGEAALADGTSLDWEKPLTDFPRREKSGHYSTLDIVTDMYQQMQSGKDIPSGILGRWNRLFDGTGLDIDMVLESELPPPNRFERLFR